MKQEEKIYEFNGKRYTTKHLPNAQHLFVEEKDGKAYLLDDSPITSLPSTNASSTTSASTPIPP